MGARRSKLGLVAMALCLAGLHVVPHGADGVIPFLLVMTGACAAFLFIAHAIIVRREVLSPAVIVLIACGLHLLLLPTGPHFDDDLYRYAWDGKVMLAGENPFAHPPNSLDLIELWRKDQYKIPYDHVSTIYPPATQLVFWATAAVAPDSFLALKIAFSLVNLALLGVIFILLHQLGRPLTYAALYAFNPLALKEVANSGHMDPWMMLWLMAALSLLINRKEAWAVVAWSMAVLCKLMPLVLGPLLLRRLGRRAWLLVIAPVLAAVAYAPFAEEGAHLWGGLSTYGRYWVFNPGAFSLIQWAVEEGVGGDEALTAQLSRGVAGMGVLIAAVALALRLDPADRGRGLITLAMMTVGALLLLSPTVDPWYLIWLAPLVALQPSAAGLILTLAPVLSYGYYLHESDPLALRVVEYLMIYGSLAWWSVRRGRRPPLAPIKGDV